MSDITQSVYDRLAGDGTLTALLTTYNSNPAIFTADPVPEDADFPMIVTAQSSLLTWPHVYNIPASNFSGHHSCKAARVMARLYSLTVLLTLLATDTRICQTLGI